MPVNALRVTWAILIVAVIPGLLLVRALWPRRDEGTPGPLLQAFYAIVLSLSITTLVGMMLGKAPHTAGERGWLQTAGSGNANAEVVLVLVSVALFLVGLARGAYPFLARRRTRAAQPALE